MKNTAIFESKYWPVRLLSFKRPLLSLTCLFVGNLISRKLSNLGVHVQYEHYRTVPMACWLVASSITSRDSMTS